MENQGGFGAPGDCSGGPGVQRVDQCVRRGRQRGAMGDRDGFTGVRFSGERLAQNER